MPKRKNRRLYILYDGRACGNCSTDDAVVLVSCSSDEEARSYDGDFGDMACYAYTVRGEALCNERWVWDWRVQSGFSDRQPPTAKGDE